MTKISSKSTFIYKRLLPVFWFGFLGVFVAVSLIMGAGQAPLQLVIGPIAIAIVGFFFFRRFVWDLADEMMDGRDHLLVKLRGVEERIPLSNIMNVSVSSYVNPPRVSLRLVNSGNLGSEIVFAPQRPFTLNPFARNPVAEDLLCRADAALMEARDANPRHLAVAACGDRRSAD